MSSNNRGTVESSLVRQLDIRFIDARQIVTEAKLNLDIHGYPNKEQAIMIESEAVSIFYNRRSQKERNAMMESYASLNATKGLLLEASSSSSSSYLHHHDYYNYDDGDDDYTKSGMSNSNSCSSFSSFNSRRSGGNNRFPLSFLSPKIAFRKVCQQGNNHKLVRNDMRFLPDDL